MFKPFSRALLLMMTLRSSKGITILQGPANTTANAGERVIFRCRFSGTQDLPLWNIGGMDFYSDDLPTGFEYTDEGLYIHSVWESLNNTNFTCFFTVHTGGGRLSRIESPPAYLVVYSVSHDIRDASVNQSTDSLTTAISTTENRNKSTFVLNSTSSTNNSGGELPITQCASTATSNIIAIFTAVTATALCIIGI